MTRNLKALGLALVAVFAMSAVVASGAQALKVTTGANPAVLTGEPIKHEAGEVTPFMHSFTLSSGVRLACEITKFVSTSFNNDISVTVIPTYEKCHAIISGKTFPATVTMEDCDYVFHGGVKDPNNSTTFEKGEADLVCPLDENKVPKKVVIHIYENSVKHGENNATCTVKVAGFTNRGSNVYHNNAGTPDDVSITSTFAGIPVTREGSLLCGPANMTATYTGSTTVTAYEDKGTATPKDGTLSEVKEGTPVNLTVSE